MHKKRLLKLAELLEADAKNKKGIKFDLQRWAMPTESDGSFSGKPEVVPVNCGTTACAVGLACISGAFRRSGLAYSYVAAFGGAGFYLEPKFQGQTNFRAVEDFWGITEKEAEFLFMDLSYPRGERKGAKGERFVAKRIRDFVAGKIQP